MCVVSIKATQEHSRRVLEHTKELNKDLFASMSYEHRIYIYIYIRPIANIKAFYLFILRYWRISIVCIYRVFSNSWYRL